MDQPTLVPSLFYRDPLAALKRLEAAFGFETVSLVTDAEGKVGHSQMTFLGGAVSIGGEWDGPPLGEARMRSPISTGGVATQFISVQMPDRHDAHCERARAAGARIIAEPEDQFYGARIYRALDPEGHIWNFSQDVRHVTGEEMARDSGLTISGSLREAGLG